MSNLTTIVASLADVFDHLQLRFAVGGALANNFWGVVRTTYDIDCLIALPAVKYQMLADQLAASGCFARDDGGEFVPVTVPRLRKQVQQHSVIECFQHDVRIELFVPIVPLQEEILRRAVMLPLGNREVPITTAEDLILLKLAFHRAKDVQDVRGILWVQRGRLDLDYLRHWSARTHEADVQQELERLIADYYRQEEENDQQLRG
jgi:predicted nucleotidyltransferase